MTPYVAPRNPGLSVLLSFLWAGLGQIYNGQPLIGVPLAALVAGVGFLDYRILQKVEWVGWSSAPSEVQLFFQASLGGLAVIWLWSMWYAHHVATRINAGVGVSASPPAARATATASPSASVGTTGDPGEDTWRLIETSRDKALLEEFIAKFPDHPRAMMARILIERSSNQSGDARETVLTPAPPVLLATPEGTAISGGQTHDRKTPPPFYWGRAAAAVAAVGIAFLGVQFYTGNMTLPRSPHSEPPTRPVTEIETSRPEIITPAPTTPSLGPSPEEQERQRATEYRSFIEETRQMMRDEEIRKGNRIIHELKPQMQLELIASPTAIRANTSDVTTITWRSVNADRCILEGPMGYRMDSTSGSVTGTSERPTRLHFQFTCWQGDRMDYETVDVDAR